MPYTEVLFELRLKNAASSKEVVEKSAEFLQIDYYDIRLTFVHKGIRYRMVLPEKAGRTLASLVRGSADTPESIEELKRYHNMLGIDRILYLGEFEKESEFWF